MKISKTYRLAENSLAQISIIKKKTNAKTDTEVIEKALQLYNMVIIGANEDFYKEDTKQILKNLINILGD